MQGYISIVLVDDHTMMREGTRRLLEEDADLRVVGEAQDGQEALHLCQAQHPQVVVLDIAMKGMNGFSVAQALLKKGSDAPAILVLTAYDQVAYVRAMLRLGVRGHGGCAGVGVGVAWGRGHGAKSWTYRVVAAG